MKLKNSAFHDTSTQATKAKTTLNRHLLKVKVGLTLAVLTGSAGAGTINWVVPDSSASNNATFDIQWDIASASVAIVGQIDNSLGSGEMVQPAEAFGASDHQFASVPEASSLLLTALASLAMIRRRR